MHKTGKRIYDVFFSLLGLILLAPLFLFIALAVKLGDGGPVFFRQERVGLGARPFRIWKFRTMFYGAERRGLSITAGQDSRITRVGYWLRRGKVDELPQLLNVLTGEMSLVGPRPEVPRYVALYSEQQRRVLSYLPGITDPASLEFRDEEALLANAKDVEEYYINYCIPRKLELNLRYAERRTIMLDTIIILRTIVPWFGDQRRSY